MAQMKTTAVASRLSFNLVSATLGNDNYSYGFDAIGNRVTSSEAGTALTYTANNLNQYTEICSAEPIQQTATPSAQLSALQLLYDADGNATMIQTSTGTWTIAYNAENRPVRFENAGTQTVVECAYDSQGRRFEKKVTVAGTMTLHHRYIYRGYLQIAALDLTRAAHPALWLVTWDPSQSTATRPLALQKDGTWFTYGYDITKNVCELFGPNGYIRTTYSYTPFGSVSASESGVVQNFQWSSEFYDSELDLGDPIAEQGGLNLYAFVGNTPIAKWDVLGKWSFWEWLKRCLGFKSTGDDIKNYSLAMGAAYLGAECIRFRNKYMMECIGKDHTQYCKKLKRDWKTVCDMAKEAASIAR